MKKVILSALFGGLLLSACSSEDPTMNTEQPSFTQNLGYVAVNISQPSSMTTRGASEASEGFEYGTEEENEAKSALFFIFNGDNIVGNPQTVALNGTGEGNNPEIERKYNAVLVIDGVSESPNVNYNIVCILNAPSGLTGIKTLSALKGEIENYGICTPGNFIMTNSVYKNDSQEILGSPVATKNIATSASAALANPVEIYVERVVAKIQAAKAGNFINGGATETVNGVEKTFTINITGVSIANQAQTSYLFKNIDGMSDSWMWDVSNKRSYWETTPSENTYANKTYSEVSSGFNWSSFNTMTPVYVQPNTSSQHTSVLVTAQLMDGDKAADLVYIRGGYTTMEGATAIIAQHVADKGYWKKESDNKYSQLSTGDFTWSNKTDDSNLSWLASYEVIPQIKSGMTLYKLVNGEYTETSDYTSVNDELKGSATSKSNYTARIYTEGKCYYYVDIDQTGVVTSLTASKPGVVRNHIYNLTLESIEGVGVPVFDPTDVIIPDEPEEENLFYLAAKVNVLAWKKVSQGLNFGKKK